MQNQQLSLSKKESLIQLLVAQQFYMGDDIITDRTRSISIKVHGSGKLIDELTGVILSQLKNLSGIDELIYLDAILKVGKIIRLNKREMDFLHANFHRKTYDFIKESLATEELLFLATVASFLEVLDKRHYDKVIDSLRKEYRDYIKKNNIVLNEKNEFLAGIFRLREVADANLSILISIEKVNDLSNILKVPIDYNYSDVLIFVKKVLEKIVSGSY